MARKEMTELARRIVERIKQDIKRGIYVDPQSLERWEKIIDEELARMAEEEADQMGWKC